jgi:hypothetical protein
VPPAQPHDIDIRFVPRAHGDTDLDVSQLAHAFYPPPIGGSLAGDIHFDINRNWTDNGSIYDLRFTAVHEIGHSLGLDQSFQGTAMGPDYPFNNGQLSNDDIVGVRRVGAVAELVGIEVGVVSGVMNLESSGVEASDWRLRHEQAYHEACFPAACD